jgi:hypothetical protein
VKVDVWVFFADLWRKYELHYNLTRITGTLHVGQYTLLIISHSFLLRMGNVSYKSCRENLAAYEIVSKNSLERGRPQMTIWRMRIACWITKTTNTHTQNTQYLLFFLLQQWLHERVSLLRYVYIVVFCRWWSGWTFACQPNVISLIFFILMICLA